MQTPEAKSKILNWGQRYSLGDLFDIPSMEGHEIALVSSGIRGGRINYFPPATRSVECLRLDARDSTEPAE